MPRLATNYTNNINYKFVCNDLTVTDVYVGHTTNFKNRKNQHKFRCNTLGNPRYHLKIYETMRNNGGWLNWSMIEIEKFPCNDSNEACKRERYWYELLNTKEMNTLNPQRGLAEILVVNRVARLANCKAYRDANKEIFYLKKKERLECECGTNYQRSNKSKHIKVCPAHLKYLADHVVL